MNNIDNYCKDLFAAAGAALTIYVISLYRGSWHNLQHVVLCCVQVTEDVRAAARRKFEEDRADAALRAAAAGDVPRLQRLLDRGCPADVADYDMRTALMLGAAKGHKVRAGKQ